MNVLRREAQKTSIGPAAWFTGTVKLTPLATAAAPGRVACASVTFSPGARTAWHFHPLGQILVVTAGKGWTACEGGPKTEIRVGDVITCNANHRHWHGATSDSEMTHIAIQEGLDGKMVEWMEQVPEDEYLAPVAAE